MGRYDYVIDGFKSAHRDEYHGYVVRVRRVNNVFLVCIPHRIAKHLGLRKGDLVEVVIRKISEDEAMREYGFIYDRYRTIKVKCPLCGREGNLVVRVGSKGNVEVLVKHRRGYPQNQCYISKYLAPEAYRDLLKKYIEHVRRWRGVGEREKVIEKEIKGATG